MSFLYSLVHSIPYSNKPIAKDLIASLHGYFTCNILIAFAIILSFKHFGGRPIECLLPSGFSHSWEQYAESFCWAQDTYFVSPRVFVEDVSAKDRHEQRISYYKWTPFFMLFQAACFYSPTLLWKYFAGHSGIKMGQLLRLASDPTNSTLEIKKANINALSTHLQGALRFHERLKKKKLRPHKVLRFLNIRYSLLYISAIYMTSKIVFLINTCFQLHLLNLYFLPGFRNDFGLNAWLNLLFPSGKNSSWFSTGFFPRITLCDFEVREMGNIQTHTVQCVLIVNIFTEKVFIFLWMWFAVLITITAMSVFHWLYLLLSSCSKQHFILNHLAMNESDLDKDDFEAQGSVDKFLRKYLGIDGILVLRMVDAHADIVFSTELVMSLWTSYCYFEKRRKDVKRINEVWPKHRQQLRMALLEETNLARKCSEDFFNAVERKRSFYHETHMNEAFGNRTLLESKSNVLKGLNRQRSFDDLCFNADAVSRYPDGSNEEIFGLKGKSSKSNSSKSSPYRKASNKV